MKNRSRSLVKRLLVPAGAILAMLAFFVPAASALEEHHYAGVTLQPGQTHQRTFPYATGVTGNRAIGEGSKQTCQWTFSMWGETEQKTCGAGSAGNGFNNLAHWDNVTMGGVYNNASTNQRVDGYFWTKHNMLGNTSNGTTEWSGRLYAGEELESANWKFRFAMQPDGNAVVYNNGTGQACWNTHTNGNPGAWAGMQSDGNFVIYSSGGTPLFNTGTNGQGSVYGAYMFMQDDGNLVIYKGGTVTPIWASSWVTGQIGC